MDGRRLALARLRDDLPLSVACALLLALVACGVAGLLALDAQARDAAVRTRIAQLAPDRASLTVGTSTTDPVPADGVASGEEDRAVRDDVDRDLGDLPVTVRAAARSDQLAVTDPVAVGATDVVLLVAQDLPDLAALVDGGWARAVATGEPSEVAVQADAAAALGVAVGDGLTVTGSDGAPRELVVSGTWRVREGAGAAVGGDPLVLTGRQSASAVGPLVPADPALLGEAARTWWVTPDVERLDLDSARRLPGAVQSLVGTVRADPRLPAARTGTGLTEDLADVVRAAGAAGATGRVVLLLVTVTALTAVLVVASLLVQRRSGHTALLRARGASWPQVVWSTLVETALLVLPALVVAVVLAATVPTLRASAGALVVCALVAAVVLALPAVLAARRWEAVRENASGRRFAAARVGGELVVVAGAALSLWQLRRQGGITTVQDGGLLDRADLVVVAAPVLGLLAGALVTARVVQPVAAVAARALAERRSLPALVAAWQTSRAPGPYAVAVLLIVVLVGTGVLVVGTSATREAETRRVAQQQTGADVRVVTDRPVGANPAESVGVAAALGGVDGVVAVRGLLVEAASTSAGPVQVVARTSDPARVEEGAGPVVAAAGTVEVAWTVGVLSRATISGVQPGDGLQPFATDTQVVASTWWLSRSGYPLRLEVGSTALTSVLGETVTRSERGSVELPAPPAGPDDAWRLVAVDVAAAGLGGSDQSITVQVTGLSAGGGPVDPAGGSWSAQGTTASALAVASELPGLVVEVPFQWAPRVTARALATDVVAAAGAPVTATVTRGLLRASGAGVGERLLVRRVLALDAEVEAAVGDVDGVPGDVVVVDQRTLANKDLAAGRDPAAPGQWEVDLVQGPGREAASARVADAAAGTGLPVRVVDREALAAALAADPLSGGALRTGLLGGVVVLLLALAGLVAGGAVSARRRLRDDTVLAVLGADARQQRRADLVRTLLVGALAVVAGLGTGYVVLVLTGPALVGDPTALGRPAGVPAQLPLVAVAGVAVLGAVLSAVPALVRDPAARTGVAARMRFEEGP